MFPLPPTRGEGRHGGGGVWPMSYRRWLRRHWTAILVPLVTLLVIGLVLRRCT